MNARLKETNEMAKMMRQACFCPYDGKKVT